MGHVLHPAALQGCTAVVFDGGTAVAAAIAQGLAAAGLRVVMAGRNAVKTTGPIVHLIHDEHDDTCWQALLAAAGDAQFVVIAPASDMPGDLDQVGLTAFRAMEAAHIVRPWLIFKHMLPVLAKSDSAAFAVVMSDAGAAARAGHIADAAAFGALRSMFKSVVLECGESSPSVRVNAVIADPRAPAGDVSDAVLHLLSSDTRFMTGGELHLGAP